MDAIARRLGKNFSFPPPGKHQGAWGMGSSERRRDVVYVQYRINRGTIIPRVLDLAYVDGCPWRSSHG
jgi:hypothetical protein